MMRNSRYNRPNHPDVLNELQYPSGLRPDGQAITLGDTRGNTYVKPVGHHDFDMTRTIIDHGLSVGSIVTLEGYDDPMIMYGPDTDLLPLPSIFNSETINNSSQLGINLSLLLVARLLRDLEVQCHLSPASPVLDMFAIDKESQRAELIAPYVPDLSVVPAEDTLSMLRQDALEKTISDDLRDKIVDCFEASRIWLDKNLD